MFLRKCRFLFNFCVVSFMIYAFSMYGFMESFMVYDALGIYILLTAVFKIFKIFFKAGFLGLIGVLFALIMIATIISMNVNEPIMDIESWVLLLGVVAIIVSMLNDVIAISKDYNQKRKSRIRKKEAMVRKNLNTEKAYEQDQEKQNAEIQKINSETMRTILEEIKSVN